ncbi:MAG: hypothetical protein WD079_06335 [Phycisphaeraceae bacterium]
MLMRRMLCLLTVLTLLTAPALADDRETVAYWNFDGESLEPTLGQGEIKHDFATVSFYTGSELNMPALPEYEARAAEEGDNRALALTSGSGTEGDGTGGNNGRSVYFRIDTTGRKALEMSFAARRSATGFNRNALAYSTDNGRSFTAIDQPFTPKDSFAEHTFDLSAIEGVNSRDALIVRLTFTGASHSQGNNRLDNVHFTVAAPSE